MIKASEGGGGKGIRKVDDEKTSLPYTTKQLMKYRVLLSSL